MLRREDQLFIFRHRAQDQVSFPAQSQNCNRFRHPHKLGIVQIHSWGVCANIPGTEKAA
jgi:hypothetical protein